MRYQTLQAALAVSLAVNVAFAGYHAFSSPSRGLEAALCNPSAATSRMGMRAFPQRHPQQMMTTTTTPAMMDWRRSRAARLVSRAEAGASASASAGPVLSIQDGKFVDYRWKEGTWDKAKFVGKDEKIDWDAIIDAEIARRKMVIAHQLPTSATDDVTFDAAEIPWWAWMKRFHLPEAEKLNGRAAMIGYMAALGVDQLTRIGIYDQHTSLWGRLTVAATVVGVFYYREFGYENLTEEQKMAVDEVKEQLLGFLDQGKKTVGVK
mmetsp:Transcript_12223/g.30088  ORF Transcript_12223/g.30088 Transcript_12223/m.30088 type:complete len:264 (-) Transcript_12223:455-1246(-)